MFENKRKLFEFFCESVRNFVKSYILVLFTTLKKKSFRAFWFVRFFKLEERKRDTSLLVHFVLCPPALTIKQPPSPPTMISKNFYSEIKIEITIKIYPMIDNTWRFHLLQKFFKNFIVNIVFWVLWPGFFLLWLNFQINI